MLFRSRGSPSDEANASAGPSAYGLMLTKPKPKPKPRDDPLAAMLRQKQQEDRRGVGMDARREAEEMLKREEAKGLVLSKGKGKADAKVKGKGKVQVKQERKGKGKLHEEMDEEDDYGDESFLNDAMDDDDDDEVDAGKRDRALDRKSTRLNSSHSGESRMPSSA